MSGGRSPHAREPVPARAGIPLEVCTDAVEGAIAAERAGAGRVELCGGFLEGGTTPSAGAIAAVRARLAIGLHVLVRPRGGDFSYSAAELDVLERDLAEVKRLGADGVALGALTPDGDVDVEATGRLIAAARPLEVTFHRAFDLTRDPLSSLAALIGLGADRVLTSGQEASAAEGIALLTKLVAAARGRIIVLAAGGIDAANAARIVRETGVAEVHASCRGPGPERARHGNPRVRLGPADLDLDAARGATDPERVRALVAALAEL